MLKIEFGIALRSTIDPFFVLFSIWMIFVQHAVDIVGISRSFVMSKIIFLWWIFMDENLIDFWLFKAYCTGLSRGINIKLNFLARSHDK